MPSTSGEKYFVGDIQGCFDELQLLLQKVNFKDGQDTLYVTGDLVARGPKSLETLRFIKSLGNSAKTVLGNHDLHLLSTWYGIKKVKKNDKLNALLNAPDVEELIDWLRQQPLLHNIDDKVILSHAGISPQWSIQQAIELAKEAETILRGDNYFEFLTHMYDNTPDSWHDELQGYERFRYIINSFSRMRFCRPDGSLELQSKCGPNEVDPQQLVPWYRLKHESWQGYTLVFGHWASLMGETGEQDIIALDTGCVWGNYMTAWRMSDNQYIRVDAL